MNIKSIKLTKTQNEALKEYLEDSEDLVDPEILQNIKIIVKNIKSGVPMRKEELNEFYDDIILYYEVFIDSTEGEQQKEYKSKLVSIEELKRESFTE